jgi:hypothetical protein
VWTVGPGAATFMGGEEDFVGLSTQLKSSIPLHNQGYAARVGLSPVGPRRLARGTRGPRRRREVEDVVRAPARADKLSGGPLQQVAGKRLAAFQMC